MLGSFWQGALLGALVAIGGALPALRAQDSQGVYKSVDAQGHVVYSDRGTSKSASKTSLRVEEANPAEAARLAKEQQALTAADAARSKQQAADGKARAAADRKKEDACRNARNEYNRLDTRAPFRRDADGNRVYYTDQEADALREQARKAMTAACGS
jgi:Domain of unknown function (DUF4124)